MSPIQETETALIGQLHRLIEIIEAGELSILPHTNMALLQSIVEAAAQIFKATGSAIALISEDGQELEFKVSYNVMNRSVTGMRFPINRGIAGYVAMTGQSLAVASVEQDARFNRTLAEEIGYIPKSILAVPLLSGENVIGVIEILDKLSGETFDLNDIELLALFARQAALAIEQSQQLAQLQSALIGGLKRIAGGKDIPPSTGWADGDLIHLADMLKDVSMLSEGDGVACLEILRIFQTYSRAKPSRRLGVGRRL